MLSTKHRTWYIKANEWRYDEDGDDDSTKDEGFDGVIQVCTMKKFSILLKVKKTSQPI